MGYSVYFSQDGQAWVGSRIVRKMQDHVVSTEHNGIIKTTDTHRIHSAPATRQTKDAASGDENITDKPEPIIDATDTRTSLARIHKRMSQTQILAEENRTLMAALPANGSPVQRKNYAHDRTARRQHIR